MLKVIEDETGWSNAMREFTSYDFYHTWEYHQLSRHEKDTPVLFLFKQCNSTIGLPFLKRSIPNTNYFDLISVYGYPGPLTSGLDTNFDNTSFEEHLLSYLNKSRIVSVFSRLNPFIPYQEAVLKGIGKTEKIGEIVYIDLNKDQITQRKNYSRTTKRHVNKLHRLCDVVYGKSEADIEQFIQLYYTTMNRVNAEKEYFFDKEYFFKFIQSEEFQTDLIFARMKDSKQNISGALMVKTNNIVQYHLSGTLSEFLHLSPLRLLIDETRQGAHNEKYHFFNLGGGLGSQEDSLFFFKSSFSKDFKPFKVWKYVVNHHVYKELCKKRNLNFEMTETLESSRFFPLYRI